MPLIGVLLPATLRAKLIAPADRARLEALGPVAWNPHDRHLDLREATALLAGCRVGIGSWGTLHPGTPGLLAACPALELWMHAAGSVKSMFGELNGRRLAIGCCKSAIAACVADFAVAGIVAGLRGLFWNAQGNRGGIGGKDTPQTMMPEACIGIVGASEVGRRVIPLLRAFAPAEILCHDPFLSDADARALGCERVGDLVELCRRSHAVSLHTPLLPATRHLIGARELAAMRDGALFVNTARGECVDQTALLAELRRGRISALLDVTAPEPAPADHPFRSLPNVVLTSHIAGPPTTLIGRQTADDVAAFLAGGMPRNLQTPDMLERVA